LLHDVDKLDRVKPDVNGLTHAQGSADWLARRGYAELGPAISGHPVTLLADRDWFETWIVSSTPETLIVSYADKRAGQRLESMTQRFASWEHRYPPALRSGRPRGSWTADTVEQVWHRAEELESRVCEISGIRPDEVRRLEWTGRAIAAARGARGGAAARQTAELEWRR
jgi:hypothetical protein